MSKFADSQNREWSLAVTTGAIKAVREACSVDLGAADPTEVDRLVDDPVLLVDVLWVLCRKQAAEKGISDEQFGEALVGDPIDAAVEALIEAITDFFPGQRRSLLRTAHAKAATLRKKASELALAKLNDPDLEERVLAEMTAGMDAEVQRALTQLNSPTN